MIYIYILTQYLIYMLHMLSVSLQHAKFAIFFFSFLFAIFFFRPSEVYILVVGIKKTYTQQIADEHVETQRV